jgi:hypothetical protein
MAIEWSKRDPGYAGMRGMCPFVDRALDPSNPSFFPHGAHGPEAGEDLRRMPVMLRLDAMTPAAFAEGRRFFSRPEDLARWRRSVRVPRLYTEGNQKGRTRIVCTAMVTRWFLEEIGRNAALRAAVVRVTLGLPLRAECLPPHEKGSEGAP